jgi:hypothetical protein
LGNEDLDWIRGGTVDIAHLGDLLQRVQDIDWKTVAQVRDEGVAGADRFSVPGSEFDKVLNVARTSNEARPRGLTERQAKEELRTRIGQSFMDIFDGLDEVRLSDDDVETFGHLYPDCTQFHISPPA